MKKPVLAALLALSLGQPLAPAAHAQTAPAAFSPFVVRDIRIEGIQRIEAGTVFTYLPVKVGDRFTTDRAQEAVRALYATGFFRDVRLEVEGDVLVVAVEERPAIAQIDFVGVRDFSEEQVRKSLKDNNIGEGRTYDRAVLEQAEQEIKRQYLTRGKYGATVTTTVTPLERNRVSVTFTVDEGEVAKIRRINIVGNQAFNESELLDLFVLQTPGFMTWYTKNDQYSRQKLSGDIESLRSFYQNRGYLDFTVDGTQVSISPDKQDVFISVTITEGEKYTVSDVKLAGDLIAPEEELRNLIRLRTGQPFSRQLLTESTKAITDRLGNDGYAFANANAVPEVDKEKRTVAFTILVDPGRRVYVRRINIVGNTRTRDEVVRRELRQLEGAFYDNQKLQRSKRRLDLTQFFTEVAIETEPVADTPDQVDITLRVRERPTGSLVFGVGFSSSEKFLISGSLSQQNLFGSGNALGLQLSSGQISRTYALSFTNPYWTVDGVSRGIDVYNRRFDPRPLGLGSYRTETRGIGLRFGYPVTEIDTINFGVAYEQTRIDVFEDSPVRFIRYVEEFGRVSNLVIGTAGWARDGRDSALWPTSGSLQRISVESSFPGAPVKYYKAGLLNTFFYPLSRDYTFAFTTDFGVGGGYGGQELPFFKAYYAGGPNSVRGYSQSSLGPRDVNGVLGGSRKAVASAEVLFPFPGIGQDRTVRLGMFFDAGQVWSVGREEGALRTYDDLGLRYSAGLSFSWISPVGPLKLSFAHPVRTKDGDRIQRFQFTLGTTF